MKRLRKKRLTLSIITTLIVSLAAAALALGDDLANDIDLTVDATRENVNLTAGGAQGTVGLYVVERNGDGKNGCNLQSVVPSVTFSVTSSDTSVATVSPSSITITNCAAEPSVTVTPVGEGSADISFAVTSNSSAGSWSVSPANFSVNVGPAPPSDATPPSLDYQVSPAPNGAGWNNSTPVDLTWSYSDEESTPSVTSGCVNEQFTAETSGAIRSCTVESAGGSTTMSVTVKIDTTKPVISSDTNGYAPGGWTNGNVTVDFTCADTGSVQSGIAADTVAGTTLTGSGADQSVTNSGACTDAAGNSADSATVSDIDIDKAAPTNAVTGVSNNATYQLGAVPAAGCTTTDQVDLSGVASSASVSTTGGTPNGVGTFTATCSGGSDIAGNNAADASVTYRVVYSLAAVKIGQPINTDNTSLFSRGKSVPVKFQLPGDEPTGFGTSGWSIKRVAGTCPVGAGAFSETGEQAALSTSSAGLRYDAAADQYVYNADFRSEAVGSCWKVRVALDDGTSFDSAVFKLQK